MNDLEWLLKPLKLVWTLLLLLSACQIKFHPQKDKFDIYRATLSQEPASEAALNSSLAIRDSEKQVVADQETMDKLLKEQEEGKSLMPPNEVNCPNLGLWDNPYKSEAHYNQALNALKAKQWDLALEEIEKAKTFCEGFEYQSSYHYLRALVFVGKGQTQKATEEFQAFLKKSERIKPASFSNYFEEMKMGAYRKLPNKVFEQAMADFAKARENAKRWLQQSSGEGGPGSALSSSMDVPKPEETLTYSDNGYIKPGGSRNMHFLLLPVFGRDYRYSLSGHGHFGLTTVIPAYAVFLVPRYYSSSLLGTIYGLTVRYPFFESASKDLNIELIGHYSTARKGTVVSNGFDARLENAQDGADYGFGLGATKRLSTRWSVSAQIDQQYSFFRDANRTLGTGFASYSIHQFLEIYSGYIKDDFQAGLGIFGFMQIGYNFRYEGLSMQVVSLSY